MEEHAARSWSVKERFSPQMTQMAADKDSQMKRETIVEMACLRC